MNLLIYSTDTELFSISPYRSPLFFETPGTGLYVYGRVVPKSPIRLSKRLPLPHVSKLTKHNGRSLSVISGEGYNTDSCLYCV